YYTDLGTRSLHDALPISAYAAQYWSGSVILQAARDIIVSKASGNITGINAMMLLCSQTLVSSRAIVVLHEIPLCLDEEGLRIGRSEEHTSELQSRVDIVC